MQCPECSYISFKIEKACRLCGFRFKKNQKGPSFSTKESFSIYSAPQVKEEQKVKGDETPVQRQYDVLIAFEKV